MSRLYHTEQGNVLPTLCEELTHYRRARKVLKLPATTSNATLYFHARSRHGCPPLRISVNGRALDPISASPQPWYLWHMVEIGASLLRDGDNTIEFWSDNTAMDGWSLAIEAAHADPRSYRSDDAGRTWRNDRMAYLNVLSGEYIVRVRLAEGDDPAPPPMRWEVTDHARLSSYRKLLPQAALQSTDRMRTLRTLTAWLAGSFKHAYAEDAPAYTPWDPETILSWGSSWKAHNDFAPILFCVHYAVAMTCACQALGIPARCAALCGSVNGMDGHFATEVWFDELKKWVYVDAHVDVVFARNGVPMSIPEIRDSGDRIAEYALWGEGTTVQRRQPAIVKFLDELYLPGRIFKNRAVWGRTDFLSHPELTPAGHGWMAYSETLLIWEPQARFRGLEMFPAFGEADYFSQGHS